MAASCTPFEPTQQPYVVLRVPGRPKVEEAYGLNGSGVLGDATFDAGPWHQPSPQAALVVARGEPLLLEAFHDDGELPTCLHSMVADAASFSPLGIPPEASALVPVSSIEALGDDLARFAFDAPAEPGEWVVRVTLTFETSPGPSGQETFFRLRVDVPDPEVDGRATAPVACVRPGEHQPHAYLFGGGSSIQADGGSFTWRFTSGSGPAPIGPLVESTTGTGLRIRIEDDVCAASWRIQLAPRPELDWRDQEPFVDLVPASGALGSSSPSRANRFWLAPIPSGDWIVQAGFGFATGRGASVGSTSNFWHVVVP